MQAEQELESDVLGLCFGYLLSRLLFFFIFGLCFVIRRALVHTACEVTPDLLSVLALSFLVMWLTTSVTSVTYEISRWHKMTHVLVPPEAIQQTLCFCYGYFVVWWVQYACDIVAGGCLGSTHYGQGTLRFEEELFEEGVESVFQYSEGGEKDARAGNRAPYQWTVVMCVSGMPVRPILGDVDYVWRMSVHHCVPRIWHGYFNNPQCESQQDAVYAAPVREN
jgi:hypothetical protein